MAFPVNLEHGSMPAIEIEENPAAERSELLTDYIRIFLQHAVLDSENCGNWPPLLRSADPDQPDGATVEHLPTC